MFDARKHKLHSGGVKSSSCTTHFREASYPWTATKLDEMLRRLSQGWPYFPILVFRMDRMSGILASAAKQRASIVPLPPPASTAQSCQHRNIAEEQNPRPRNYKWSQLMARVFALDVLECPRCGAQIRSIAAI